jgi:NO-binding membrane sensor protein with MHYT domain
MHGSYNPLLVALAILIAALAAYAALDLAGRITASRARHRAAWLVDGSLAIVASSGARPSPGTTRLLVAAGEARAL